MKKVIIASKNPVKINATKSAFEKMFPDDKFSFEGISVPSGVSDQPMSEDETLTGAKNRAKNVSKKTNADYYVGIEGGLREHDGRLECFAWMIVQNQKGSVGMGRTGSFFLPDKVAELVREGMELGDADDRVFGNTNSKQKNGAVGLLTNDVITRTKYYVEALSLALIPFVQPDLY